MSILRKVPKEELSAMKQVIKALGPLPKKQRSNVLSYICCRMNIEIEQLDPNFGFGPWVRSKKDLSKLSGSTWDFCS